MPPKVRKIAADVYVNGDDNAKRNMDIIAKGSQKIPITYGKYIEDIPFKLDRKKAKSLTAFVYAVDQPKDRCLGRLGVVYNPRFFAGSHEYKRGVYTHENVHLINRVCNEIQGNNSVHSNPYSDAKGWSAFHHNFRQFNSRLESIVNQIVSIGQSSYALEDNELCLGAQKARVKGNGFFKLVNNNGVVNVEVKDQRFNKAYAFNADIMEESISTYDEKTNDYFWFYFRPQNKYENFLVNAYLFMQKEMAYRNKKNYAIEMSAYIDQFFPRRIQERIYKPFVTQQDKFRNDCLKKLKNS